MVIVLALLPFGGCTEDEGPDGPVDCATTSADVFVVGLQKTGEAGRLDFQMQSAAPVPVGRGDNEWIVKISALADGAPVTGATIYVTPAMPPPNQHGTPVKAVITPMPTPGHYKFAPVNLWMPGVWETSIEVESAAGADTAIYRFCIPS